VYKGWRQLVAEYINKEGPQVITTQEFRGLSGSYAKSAGKEAKQRTIDSFLKELVDEGVLSVASRKGIYINKAKYPELGTRTAIAALMSQWKRNDSDFQVFGGPAQITQDKNETQQQFLYTNSKNPTKYVGLAGCENDDPRGQALIFGVAPAWIHIAKETFDPKPTVAQSISTLYDKHSVNSATPEYALLLWGFHTTGRSNFSTVGTVEVQGIEGEKIRLTVKNPDSGTIHEGQVNSVVLESFFNSLQRLGDKYIDSPSRPIFTGLERITSPQSMTIAQACEESKLQLADNLSQSAIANDRDALEDMSDLDNIFKPTR